MEPASKGPDRSIPGLGQKREGGKTVSFLRAPHVRDESKCKNGKDDVAAASARLEKRSGEGESTGGSEKR